MIICHTEIWAVDGITKFELQSQSPEMCIEFLQTHAHEGCQTKVTIQAEDGDVLKMLEKVK